MYKVETVYSLRFLELFGNTTLYNRTLSSNNLILSTDKAITALGCTGMKAGATLNLMSEEDIAKCERQKIEHIIENHSSEEFNITIINVSMKNPDDLEQTCTMIDVNSCYVVYPSGPPNRILIARQRHSDRHVRVLRRHHRHRLCHLHRHGKKGQDPACEAAHRAALA
ncbi:hypothetical protein WA577_004292 [Blastocystis sp. JDR]